MTARISLISVQVMTDYELNGLTLCKALRLVQQRQISSSELRKAVLDRIDRLNAEMHAFITVLREEPIADDTPPLFGVPLSVKDLYDTKGIRTTAGAKLYTNRIPEEDAAAVTKLKQAGAAIIGKANMHEFAYGVTTVNPHFGTARNPWNPDYISGGSSGGSANAVAMSMGFGSLGSDTGGSIRIPASLCGVVGLKPTYGRCSLRGIVPLSWSMDHPGPIAQTVEDVALLLGVIAGYDSQDPFSQDKPVTDVRLDGNVKGLRIGLPRPYFFDDLDPQVESAVNKAVKTFERLGASIHEVDLKMAPLQRGIWSQIASPEAYSLHEELLKEHGGRYGADVKTRIEVGRLLLSIDYVRAQRAR